MHNIQSPRTDDAGLETEIAARASVAPRVTPADIEATIASEHFFTGWHGVQGAFEAGELHNIEREYDTLKEPPPATTAYESLRLLTFCVLRLRNGFTVVGESACVSQENFDADIGRKVARANAVNKIWPLLGYTLRDSLHRQAAA